MSKQRKSQTKSKTKNKIPRKSTGRYAGRRRVPWQIVIAASVGRALLLTTIPIAFVLGVLSMAQLYLVSFAVGTLWTWPGGLIW